MEEKPETPKEKPVKKPDKGKIIFGIVVFVIGTLVLIAGVVWLVLDLIKKPIVRDADYLVSVGAWQLEDSSEVVWNFAEVGKGTLTTNFHINDYDFRWRMDGDRRREENSDPARRQDKPEIVSPMFYRQRREERGKSRNARKGKEGR